MAAGTIGAILGGAAIAGGVVQGALGSRGASAQASAANRAADAQLQGTRETLALQRDIYDQTRADAAPFREGGLSAFNRLAGEVDRPFETTPAYAFQFDEGTRAIERSAAARGGLNSGATMKALNRFGQGIASQEYGNYLNRLSALAGVGQTTNSNLASVGQNFAASSGNAIMSGAANQGNALMAAGNARASGYGAIGNAFTGTINNGLGIAAMGGAFGGGGTAFPQNRWSVY